MGTGNRTSRTEKNQHRTERGVGCGQEGGGIVKGSSESEAAGGEEKQLKHRNSKR